MERTRQFEIIQTRTTQAINRIEEAMALIQENHGRGFDYDKDSQLLSNAQNQLLEAKAYFSRLEANSM
jgi:hypothetical protein